jgi:hypothetical protein
MKVKCENISCENVKCFHLIKHEPHPDLFCVTCGCPSYGKPFRCKPVKPSACIIGEG